MIILPSESLRDFPTETAEQVRPVLRALTSLSLLVVSGAGLAVPIIPPMSTLAWQLALDYLQLGSFSAHAVSRSELRDRLLPAPKALFTGNRADSLGSAPVKLDGWQGQLVLTASDEALSALFQVKIYRPLKSMAPPNYRIFGYVQPPALLFDFNNDAFLANYCEPPHTVLNPHRNIDRRFIEHPEFALFFHAATDYGLLLPNFSHIWLPRPEPKWITRRQQYNLARCYLTQRGQFLLLVGYSFGRQPRGVIDDIESFEFFREILKRFPRQIVVVDPSPEHVAGLFEDALRQRIYACKLYWNQLAKAACLAMKETPGAPNLLAIQSRIGRLYDERTR
jgi:hypothetical protein